MIESEYLRGREDLCEKLRKFPFLGAYEDHYLLQILELSRLRSYDAEEVITREGEYDFWFYLILSGEVRVVKRGREIARLDSHGGTFGELAVIDGEPRSATVIAAAQTVCLAVDGAFLERMDPAERPPFEAIYYRVLAKILAHRLRLTSAELSRAHAALDGEEKWQ